MPYAIVVVELDEGPRIVCSVRDLANDDARPRPPRRDRPGPGRRRHRPALRPSLAIPRADRTESSPACPSSSSTSRSRTPASSRSTDPSGSTRCRSSSSSSCTTRSRRSRDDNDTLRRRAHRRRPRRSARGSTSRTTAIIPNIDGLQVGRIAQRSMRYYSRLIPHDAAHAAADHRRGQRPGLRRRDVPLARRRAAHRGRVGRVQRDRHRQRAHQHRARRELAAPAADRRGPLATTSCSPAADRRRRGAAHGPRVAGRARRRAAARGARDRGRACASSAPTAWR